MRAKTSCKCASLDSSDERLAADKSRWGATRAPPQLRAQQGRPKHLPSSRQKVAPDDWPRHWRATRKLRLTKKN